jgi:hypothetical protein
VRGGGVPAAEACQRAQRAAGARRPTVRLSYSAESAAIQQYFSLIANQRTVLSATVNQRIEQTRRRSTPTC